MPSSLILFSFLTQTTNIHPLIRNNPTAFFPTFACNHYFHRFLYRTTIKFSLVHVTHQCFEKKLQLVALNIKKKSAVVLPIASKVSGVASGASHRQNLNEVTQRPFPTQENIVLLLCPLHHTLRTTQFK